MLRRSGYRYRLDPSAAQQAFFRRIAGAVRFVWNWGLAQRTQLWAVVKDLSKEDRRAHRLTVNDQINQLPALKQQFPFLALAPSHCLQQVLRNLDSAFERFFAKEADYPCFRRKGERVSFRFPDPTQFTIDEREVDLPKVGRVRYRNSRAILGRIKQATVSWDGLHWHISVLSEREVGPVDPPRLGAVGIDLGIAQSVTCSTGQVVHFPVPGPADLTRLDRLQRRISRRRRGSRRRERARIAYLRFHRHVVQRRVDAMHKTTTILAKNHGLVVIEDLSVRSMTASARGTKDAPGRNVRAKAALNQALQAQAFGEFRRQLTYKCEWYGSRLVAVRPAYTSQQCARCGWVDAANRPSQASFACRLCGHRAHADHNAAVNILAAGTAVAAQGANA
jgi:putative transposase